jgi:hypothetical protein
MIWAGDRRRKLNRMHTVERLKIPGSGRRIPRTVSESYPRMLLVGVILLSTGCGVREAPVTDAPTEPLPSVVGIQAVDDLRDELLRVRQLLEGQYQANPDLRLGCFEPPFTVLAPTDLAGFVADPLQVQGMGPRGEMGSGTPADYGLGPMGASLSVRLVDRMHKRSWIEIRQGMWCSGVLVGAPQGAENVVALHPVVLPGVDSHKSSPGVQSWTEPHGTTVELSWSSDIWSSPSTGYQLVGRNVSEELVVGLASTMRPVCCDSAAPTLATSAPSRK